MCERKETHTENEEESARSEKWWREKENTQKLSTLSKERKEKKKGKTVFSSLRST